MPLRIVLETRSIYMIIRVNEKSEMGMMLTKDVELKSPNWEDIRELDAKTIQMSADEFNYLYMTHPKIED
ncbi:hypothetical protein NVP1054O_04 [Vibrio phage 1.054.O._10N.261.52.A1]|nr:hypothetical protein NVP1054O_04 [Vibrio phage 1.054.O._10N.261.52.A1]